jgi:GT2 family glycosyltransferase
MTSSLSLVICTRRRPAALARLLKALEKQSEPPEEVLVVDGSPDDETEKVVLPLSERASLLYFRVPPEERGLTRQRNFGVARCRGDLVAFLDDDTLPDPNYFQEIRACFERHPEAGGAGGYITGAGWKRAALSAKTPLGVFRFNEWERREDYRWRLRKMLGLADSMLPGWMPPSGHGRSLGYIPPDGRDHRVEFIFGGASCWSRRLFHRGHFSTFFEGYGLYEDLDFCLQISGSAPLYLCTRARLEHYHEPSARPSAFRYGEMVVRNGWYVWRRRWPHPPPLDRLRWWAVTVLLAVCRLIDLRGPGRFTSLQDAAGRFFSICKILCGSGPGIASLAAPRKKSLPA